MHDPVSNSLVKKYTREILHSAIQRTDATQAYTASVFHQFGYCYVSEQSPVLSRSIPFLLDKDLFTCCGYEVGM